MEPHGGKEGWTLRYMGFRSEKKNRETRGNRKERHDDLKKKTFAMMVKREMMRGTVGLNMDMCTGK